MHGYPYSEILAMTPRQFFAVLAIADRQHRHDLADKMSLAALAARGEPKALANQHAKLTKDR